jgi:hypothetical protein
VFAGLAWPDEIRADLATRLADGYQNHVGYSSRRARPSGRAGEFTGKQITAGKEKTLRTSFLYVR